MQGVVLGGLGGCWGGGAKLRGGAAVGWRVGCMGSLRGIGVLVVGAGVAHSVGAVAVMLGGGATIGGRVGCMGSLRGIGVLMVAAAGWRPRGGWWLC